MWIAAEINTAATYKVGVEADFANQTVSGKVTQAGSMGVAESVNRPDTPIVYAAVHKLASRPAEMQEDLRAILMFIGIALKSLKNQGNLFGR